ncbi:MAG TPA: tRNA pseudouridine(55) synthase TruB [Pirellulaceae bacterium]|nr:tRNA pseudouridine(55) synthase TruB [Pirellulaceae bacterium]
MFGFLNIDKPGGVTSRDVVNRVQRLVRPHKVGHAGTLDPLATGVLVVAVGPATRLIEYVQRLPKTYLATFLLGRSSDTEDIAGEVVELPGAAVPTETQLRAALPQFLGTIQQRPPAFSALKVAGQRAYDLARRGDAVELLPRPVEIYDLEILRYAYPELQLLIRCGSGTYVRSLGRDLAESLGTAAVMSALRRLVIGPFTAETAIAADSLSASSIEHQLLSPLMALGEMPRIEVNEAASLRLAQGQAIENRWNVSSAEVAAVNSAGQLVAILSPLAERLRPQRCFHC